MSKIILGVLNKILLNELNSKRMDSPRIFELDYLENGARYEKDLFYVFSSVLCMESLPCIRATIFWTPGIEFTSLSQSYRVNWKIS